MAKSKRTRRPPASDSQGKVSGRAGAASGGVYSTQQLPDGTYRSLLSYNGPSTLDLTTLIKGRDGEEANVKVRSDGSWIVTTVDHRGPMPLDFDAPLARPAVEQPGDAPDADYQPARWFPKGLRARLRKAATDLNRKSMPVRSKIEGRRRLYSAADARKWWPDEFTPA